MNHIVFISYSSKDKHIAEAVCDVLEENAISCWMAPRNVIPGQTYPSQIVDAITGCQMIVLIFSHSSNESEHVCTEVDLGFNGGKLIIPFLVDDTEMNKDFKYYLNRKHWFVAYPDYKEKMNNLVVTIQKQLAQAPGSTNPIPKGNPNEPIKFVLVEGGLFSMGATMEQGKDAYDSELPASSVNVNSFLISDAPITVAQYRDYCKEVGQQMPTPPMWGWIDNHPIVNVSWYDANDFAKHYGYTLPTEAQWEYAAKGGSKSKHYKYSGGNNPSEIGWFADNTYQKSTAPVKMKIPNELGLYDMSGNVYEWCNNWKYPYSGEPSINPQGPADGLIKASRGGSWHSSTRSLRVTNRDDDPPEFYSHNVGFRVVKPYED